MAGEAIIVNPELIEAAKGQLKRSEQHLQKELGSEERVARLRVLEQLVIGKVTLTYGSTMYAKHVEAFSKPGAEGQTLQEKQAFVLGVMLESENAEPKKEYVNATSPNKNVQLRASMGVPGEIVDLRVISQLDENVISREELRQRLASDGNFKPSLEMKNGEFVWRVFVGKDNRGNAVVLQVPFEVARKYIEINPKEQAKNVADTLIGGKDGVVRFIDARIVAINREQVAPEKESSNLLEVANLRKLRERLVAGRKSGISGEDTKAEQFVQEQLEMFGDAVRLPVEKNKDFGLEDFGLRRGDAIMNSDRKMVEEVNSIRRDLQNVMDGRVIADKNFRQRIIDLQDKTKGSKNHILTVEVNNKADKLRNYLYFQAALHYLPS